LLPRRYWSTELLARETTLTGCIGYSGQESFVGFDGNRRAA
jgi:hypothetical protein